MGGNALKNVQTVRLNKKDYFNLANRVLQKLRTKMPHVKFAIIPAYGDKEDYGDLDILTNGFVDMFIIQELFKPLEVATNGPVISFEVELFQVDLIHTKDEDFDVGLDYYSYNDLGNLIGRIAHKLGFKYGHDGLSYVVRSGDYVHSVIHLSKDRRQIFDFLGLPTATFDRGFNTLNQIFEFVCSSPYFNKNIYLLDNRNHTSRTRDRKRKTYMLFLEWLETKEGLNCYPYETMSEKGGRTDKEPFMQLAFYVWPEFKSKYLSAQQDIEKLQQFKLKFNGIVVSSLTGLTGQALGQFMTHLRELKQPSFVDWVIDTSDEEIAYFISTSFARHQQLIVKPQRLHESPKRSPTLIDALYLREPVYDYVPVVVVKLPILRNYKEGQQP